MFIKWPWIRFVFIYLGMIICISEVGRAQSKYSSVLEKSFQNIKAISSENIHEYVLSEKNSKQVVEEFCKNLSQRFREFNWKENPCESVNWESNLASYEGRPLLYKVFGSGDHVSILMSAVHPDELTPIPMGFRLARYLQANPGILPKDTQVIVMPLVNPDGFFRKYPTRTNANGVDCNRNFFTIDWYEKSKWMWQGGRKRSLPHYPGFFPNSEIETLFQIQMIEMFNPDKILSIHAPLGFLDYDGPGDRKPKPENDVEQKAKQLVEAISRKTRNYKVVDYSFYPGSLGNYAGNERDIPTVTLELQTTDPRKVDEYWDKFLPGLLELIDYRFKGDKNSKQGNATNFFQHSYQGRIPSKGNKKEI